MTWTRKHRVPARPLRPSLEPLEGRAVMSVGPVFTIANSRLGDYGAVSASSNNATKVVAWQEVAATLGGQPEQINIDVQRFDKSGHAIGAVKTVASTSGTSEAFGKIAIAADGEGDVVLAYAVVTNGHSNVYALKLNSSLALVKDITVAAYTASYASSTEPSVAMAPTTTSGFVVSYTSEFGPAYTQTGVYASRYDVNGNLVQSIKVAANGNDYQRMSSVSMDEYGDFDVAYMTAIGTGNASIDLNTYSSSGALTHLQSIDSRGYVAYAPSVSVDYYGDAVVTWYDIIGAYRNVYARQVNRSGALGQTFAVTNTTAQALSPVVAMNPYSGSFVITYSLGFTNPQVDILEFSSSGTVRASYHTTAPTAVGGGVSVDGFGDYIWTFSTQAGTGPLSVQAVAGYLA